MGSKDGFAIMRDTMIEPQRARFLARYPVLGTQYSVLSTQYFALVVYRILRIGESAYVRT